MGHQDWHRATRNTIDLILTNQCLGKKEIWSKSWVMDPDSKFIK
jgi:hypothetical protein